MFRDVRRGIKFGGRIQNVKRHHSRLCAKNCSRGFQLIEQDDGDPSGLRRFCRQATLRFRYERNETRRTPRTRLTGTNLGILHAENFSANLALGIRCADN